MREKIMKLYMKALEVQRDTIYDYKTYKSEVNRSLKSGKELRVISHLYNKFLLIYTYAKLIFRNTIKLDTFESYKDEVKEAVKEMDDLKKEIIDFDENPDMTTVTVRCQRNRVRKALKDCDNAYKSLYRIGDWMEARVYKFDKEEFNIMRELVRIYIYRAKALDTLMYSMLILFKYKER